MIVKTDKDEFADFLTDAANFKGTADAVYFPEDEEDVAAILRVHNSKKIPVTIAGNGTGLTGARVPQGGVVLSTAKLNRILKINEKGKYTAVQAGVLLKDFQDEVEAKNLFYPPDPTERNCFVGATIATNSSGARTFKYGPTRNYVEGLRIILADGSALTLERGKLFAKDYKLTIVTDCGKEKTIDLPRYKMPETKHAAGYYAKEDVDAVDLFIGSEGTLGVIYSAKLKLLNFPEKFLSCVQFFPTEENALSFIAEARESSYRSRLAKNEYMVDARGLEFFDPHSLRFLEEVYPAIPKQAGAAVWFEQEYNNRNEKALFDEWGILINRHSGNMDDAWFAFNKTDYEKFKDFRHAISWRVNEYCVNHGVMKVGTDTAVPHENFYQFYDYCKKTTIDAGLRYVAYGHVGNSHIHLNMLPEDNEQFIKAREVYRAICHKAVKYGGTVSAEHGIGKLKKDYLLDMYGEESIRQMAKMKLQFDPNAILGAGNIFDEKYFI
jgi:D-lactate dehydrogenase (cytochrome)